MKFTTVLVGKTGVSHYCSCSVQATCAYFQEDPERMETRTKVAWFAEFP